MLRRSAPFVLGSLLVTGSMLGCPADDAGDEVADETGTSETGTSDTDTDTDSDTDSDTGGEYGHGNLHPDCMGDAPIVVMETNLGTLVVQLDAVRAPITVANFLGYVSAGFYDQTIFHRVIDGFVLQGGGFDLTKTNKPTEGTIPLEIHAELRHVDGAIAMARSSEPDTAESQWYITDGPQGGLDDSYAVFGVLIDGFDVRDTISAVETASATFNWGGQQVPFEDVPVEDVVLSAAYCVTQYP